ncbi:hypothetical protein [Clostridium butyricum]
MAQKINRICPYCGHKMIYDTYKTEKGRAPQCICYCDNDDCSVKPCTDSTSASNVYAEILAITGDKE